MIDFVEVTGFSAAPLGLGDFDGSRYPGRRYASPRAFHLRPFGPHAEP
jgi:hypothetical protein